MKALFIRLETGDRYIRIEDDNGGWIRSLGILEAKSFRQSLTWAMKKAMTRARRRK